MKSRYDIIMCFIVYIVQFHRPVPVIIPPDTRKPLKFLAARSERRTAGIKDENHYVFANSGKL